MPGEVKTLSAEVLEVCPRFTAAFFPAHRFRQGHLCQGPYLVSVQFESPETFETFETFVMFEMCETSEEMFEMSEMFGMSATSGMFGTVAKFVTSETSAMCVIPEHLSMTPVLLFMMCG